MSHVQTVEILQTPEPLTVESAKHLPQYGTIYHLTERDSRGDAVKAKVTSIKTWKRDPSRIEVRCKYGLYGYFTLFSANDLSLWTANEPKYWGKKADKPSHYVKVTTREILDYLYYFESDYWWFCDTNVYPRES